MNTKNVDICGELEKMSAVIGTIDPSWICPLDEAGRLVSFSGLDDKGHLRVGVAVYLLGRFVPLEHSTYAHLQTLSLKKIAQIEQEWVNRMYEIYLTTENSLKAYKTMYGVEIVMHHLLTKAYEDSCAQPVK
jgi:hypothetical protein